MMTEQAAPGVILAVWTSSGEGSKLIRVGEALMGRPAVANHVAVVTHQDTLQRWMGIEGKPGGVGPVDVTHWLTDSRTRGNYAQVAHMQQDPGWDTQCQTFLASCAKSLGIQYDWTGIAEDTCNALHLTDMKEAIDHLWRWPSEGNTLPGHVVCSSLAAALYKQMGWAHPGIGVERDVTPADWWDWSDKQAWQPAR
jgi:hypothetical protein